MLNANAATDSLLYVDEFYSRNLRQKSLFMLALSTIALSMIISSLCTEADLEFVGPCAVSNERPPVMFSKGKTLEKQVYSCIILTEHFYICVI